MTAEPPLRCLPIPLREPEAAVSVAPQPARWRGASAVPVTQGTLALAVPWETPAAISYTSTGYTSAGTVPAGALRGTLEHPPVHDHSRHPNGSRRAAGLGPRTAEPALLHQHIADQDVPAVAAVLPEPREWAANFAQAAIEVAMGLRPAAQLIRWTTPEVQEVIARRAALVSRVLRRSGTPLVKPTLRAILTCTPAERSCEVAAVVADSEKVRAMAFRMEGFNGRWRVTVFTIG